MSPQTQAPKNPAEIPFKDVIAALLDADTPLAARYIYRLSDLEEQDLRLLRPIWHDMPIWRRQRLMQDVAEMSAKDNLMYFDAVARYALQDEDPQVRILALRILDDYMPKDLAVRLMSILNDDPVAEVRAAAANSLGTFVYMGEVEDLQEQLFHDIEDTLLAVINSSENDDVRRAALSSLGYSSRQEVTDSIAKAFTLEDRRWKAAALRAMGRSANPDWTAAVLSMLDHTFPVLRMEAARAVGELELRDANPTLIELLDDPDPDTRRAAIWSLSQTGGKDAQEALQQLMHDSEDDSEIEFLDEALENLAFVEGVQMVPLLDIRDKEDEAGYDDDEDDADEEEDEWLEEVDLDELDNYDDDDELDEDDDLDDEDDLL